MIKVTLDVLDANNQWISESHELPVEKDFSIDDQNLDGEMCKMGTLLVFYGDLAAELKAQASRYKQHAEELYSTLAKGIRDSHRLSSTKITEGVVRETVYTNQKYHNAMTTLNRAERDAMKVEHFYRSLNKKADILISLCYKQRVEIAKGAF